MMVICGYTHAHIQTDERALLSLTLQKEVENQVDETYPVCLGCQYLCLASGSWKSG